MVPLPILTKPDHDEKLQDGFVRAGWRKVFNGGIVRFQGQRRHSEQLLPYVGSFVYCEIEDMWGIICTIHPEGKSWEDRRRFDRGQPYKVNVPQNN